MKEQTLYLVVNTTCGFVLYVFDNYNEAADKCDSLSSYEQNSKYKVIHIFDEEIIKVGELNVN